MLTNICDRLGLDVPIFAFSHCRDVVAAVTNAGGIGVLGATTLSPAALEIDLTWIDNETKGKPYGVDLLLPMTFARPLADDGGATTATSFPVEQQTFVAQLLERYQVPELPAHIPAHGGAINVSPEAAASLLDVAFAHPIRLVASALGPPTAELIER